MPHLKLKGFRWWIIGRLMPGSINNHLMRSTPAAANMAKRRGQAIPPVQLAPCSQVTPE